MELTKHQVQLLTGGIFDEFPLESEWDVIVIGGGPNGLMTAAYLAKAGVKVALIERRYEIGGGLVTEEILFPCYYSNAHVIYHLMVDYMPVIRDFDLDNHGMAWVKPNLQTAMVFEDGRSLLLTRMVEDTRDSFMRYSVKDAMAFGKVMRTWRRIVDEIIAPLTYLPAMSPMDLSVTLDKTDVGRELLELSEKSPYEIITENFENDRIRALLLYVSCMWGLDPRETGTGLFVPLLLCRGINKCYCYGGSHKFAGALAREIVAAGGTILDMCEVSNIITQNGKAIGVETKEGRTLKAKAVISSLDPHTTFLDLVGRENLPGTLKESVEGWVYDKWSFYTLHVASKEKPHYKAEEPWANESFMTIFGIESTDQLLAHWDNVVAGKIGDNFGGHSTCESFFDPHLVHSPWGGEVSFFQMHAPYDIEGGWEKRSLELQEAVLDKWQKVAPNFTRDKIIDTNAETPEDIEIRFPNMRRGSIKHGDYRPTQLNTFRPNVECSGHSTPIEGLYVCGVSTYPGGLVLGGSGYLAANKVAEDLGVKKWWKPTPEMERFTKTYLE
ncbi:MAG: NAD(P)/FAD-dependent oxidoreductase [Dehalococcoidia bacterium]|nr:MAG: NAD(P)/FAD-dependent oxidoreductase [Dehalococcoidia bacterium]